MKTQKNFFNGCKWEQNLTGVIKEYLVKEEEEMFKLVSSKSSSAMTVLDIGCGEGRMTGKIQPLCSNITGIDLSTEKLETYNKNFNSSGIRGILCNAKSTPFKDNHFDYALCGFQTLGNMGEEKYDVLNEIKRVVKPSGKMIFSVYSENALEAQLGLYEKCGLGISKIGEDYIYTSEGLFSERFTKEKIISTFKKVGLTAKISVLTPIAYLVEVKNKK